MARVSSHRHKGLVSSAVYSFPSLSSRRCTQKCRSVAHMSQTTYGSSVLYFAIKPTSSSLPLTVFIPQLPLCISKNMCKRRMSSCSLCLSSNIQSTIDMIGKSRKPHAHIGCSLAQKVQTSCNDIGLSGVGTTKHLTYDI